MKLRVSTLGLIVFLLLALGGAALWLGWRHEGAGQATSPPRSVEKADAPTGLSPGDLASVTEGHPLAAELNARDHPPQRDLEILREMLLSFTTSLKLGNLPPLGDNQDITAALTGRNRKKLVLIPPSHPSVDEKGRLLDRWGTPYHFHARSADSFDLRSAGPDKVLFTPDDVAWSPR
jgi:hypothetical protein